MSRTLHHARIETPFAVRVDGLPAGIAGRITGIALRYDVIDTYETTFARGCLVKSINERVSARKVPLLMDHERSVGAHVGVVVGMADTDDGVAMTAEVFDTPEGRACMEYVRAVIAAGASTGLSIGFMPVRSNMVQMDGKMVQRFIEVALREVSITPMPSVPGTEVTGARHEDESPYKEDVQDSAAPHTGERDASRSDAELLALAARMALLAVPAATRDAVMLEFVKTTQAPVAARADATLPIVETTPTVADMTTRLAAMRATFSEV